MGLVASPAVVGGLFVVFGLLIVSQVTNGTKKRYAALNARPPPVVSSWCFGLDIVISMFRSVANHQFHLWTGELLEKHNHTMELHMLGEKLVMTDDPENVKAIIDTQFTDVAKSEEQHIIFKHILGDAIFAMNGAEWKSESVLYKAHMSRVRDTDFGVTEKYMLRALDLFEKGGIDACDVIDRLQLDITTEIFCGETTNSLISDQAPFRNAMETLQKVACFRQLLGKVGVLLDDKYLVPKAVKFIDDYQDAMATKAFARSGEVASKPCLIDDLIQKGKSRSDIKNAVTSTLLAAKDPSVTTLSFAMYEVAKHPHVFARMKEEVEQNIGFDKLPVLSDLHKLKFTKMVIKETLRHHHPLGFNSRVPVRDITLPRGGGPDGKAPIAVLQGTQIIYALLPMQHRTDIGVDRVNEWLPERWETWKPRNQWEYIPFNHGPRICPGQQFANFQMEYFFARLCQEFETISLLPHSKPQEGLMRLELNTKNVHPVYAHFVRRSRE